MGRVVCAGQAQLAKIWPSLAMYVACLLTVDTGGAAVAHYAAMPQAGARRRGTAG